MRTRLISRVALGAAATALAIGTLGTGTAHAVSSSGKPHKPHKPCCKHDDHSKKSWKDDHSKTYVNKSRNFEFEYELENRIFRNNHFGGKNIVGHFYHGGNYAVGLG